MGSNSLDEEEAACVSAMQLASGAVLPMVLKAAIELDLLELINKAGEASASQLAAQLPTNNPDAANMIDRMLRLLASYSVLTCQGGPEPRYGLTPVSKYLTRNEDGVSVATMSLLIQDRVLMESWYHLKDAVLQGGVPFNRAYGMNAFEYPARDPRFNEVFNQAMYNNSTIVMKKIVETYKGFEGLETIVDVGGGVGASLKMIVSKYPSIKAINFDLPHVIQHAPSHPGVEHMGGDMFVSVPKADAVFMKICHDWSDAHCEKLLKNCYKAIPENGKVIIAETILPEVLNSGLSSSRATQSDMIMLAVNPGGKERSEKEFQALAKLAGFKQLVKICCAFNIWVMEFRK